ncbi:1-deoxy-D-xylulose 5-phosphate reductoisomerase [Candidatus Ruthia magnifica str. Cm (Calyptogena magnifica)]|uniref:1-deoxy-D-xylulose 5-phosphate reductoisomerase n=1 Tax=Ruthia magnifica subsp. Calyptogena magnifica TaxID=413404 RepID=DXR_RUTMC|nr:1-deoxy-D-xylulose-5-phosphate reductoisomerase [Candidatus Ruthturnera calyptogenae]A1AV71.1 RecName: Full=1-deoxy-D-xylulose 5-phosphate reductoisomerase; Short=DXP reductoisomerase; AltName: Full=1-deoxyxylulose-5-phosphate reductoisomerase; AltName: Full=2-C-methyl-D-erythritol 4-phosphate synthase [Candidatus Ruthia magnifica str. Cm (Calyptogena magnifica)]ABL01828.1 1-deoxy-D-xylulose 5-phosphate reductoisomerase [Candidatus Ruthia magnifica str. Cm (Calyptogena magnifica)]
MKNITLLGATGSIGKSTLSVVDLHSDKFNIFTLSANTNWQLMLELCNKYQPNYAIMVDESSAEKLSTIITTDTQILSGTQALDKVVAHQDTDFVMAAIVGTAGMSSALCAVKAGKRIMLANKESLILAGDIFMKAVEEFNAELIPVDSEHSAIFQCLQSGRSGLNKIQLTASGGPFLHTPISKFKYITPNQACAHPNWSMGRKISVDSATMMNKGLEVIEAYYLFSLTPEQIDVVVHPQSIVHSSVYYKDGSTLSQLGKPDMRTVISYAMSYPQRINSGVTALDLTNTPALEFYQPDFEKFTCLKLAFETLNKGGNAMITMNAANEIAVEYFLNHQINFLDIPKIIDQTLSAMKHTTPNSLEEVVNNDLVAREMTREIIKQYG